MGSKRTRVLANECYKEVRFALSDDSGSLCFDAISMEDAPECQDTVRKLKAYLLGRRLAKVDFGYMRALVCHGDGVCLEAVIQAIGVHQKLLLGM